MYVHTLDGLKNSCEYNPYATAYIYVLGCTRECAVGYLRVQFLCIIIFIMGVHCKSVHLRYIIIILLYWYMYMDSFNVIGSEIRCHIESIISYKVLQQACAQSHPNILLEAALLCTSDYNVPF